MTFKGMVAGLKRLGTRNSQETLTYGGSEHAVGLFRLCGNATFASASDFRDRLIDSIERGMPVVIDLSTVKYVDSAFLAVLVEGKKRAQSRGQTFQVRGACGRTQAIIGMARLAPVFDLATEAPALRAAA